MFNKNKKMRLFSSRDASWIGDWRPMDYRLFMALCPHKYNTKYHYYYGNYECQDYLTVIKGYGITVGVSE
jgi:hypothetical protein